MEKGFIKLFRTLLKWKWYDDANTFRLFMHLLLIANWEDKAWHKIIVKRGQVVTSQKHLAKDLRLTRQQVRRALDNLETTNEITKSTTAKYTLITINNYDLYQSNNQVNNQQTTNKQPTNNQQTTTTKEYKEYKNKRNIYIPKKKKIDSHVYDFEELERNLARANKK